MYLLGLTTYPFWYGSSFDDPKAMFFNSSTLSFGTNTSPFSTLLLAFAGWMGSNGLMAGKIWRRIKGFFKKFASTVKGKVWPILRPLASTALSVIPGPAALIASRLLAEKPIVNVTVDGDASSTAALVSGPGATPDKFLVNVQYHICELDANKLPIVVDPLSPDESSW